MFPPGSSINFCSDLFLNDLNIQHWDCNLKSSSSLSSCQFLFVSYIKDCRSLSLPVYPLFWKFGIKFILSGCFRSPFHFVLSHLVSFPDKIVIILQFVESFCLPLTPIVFLIYFESFTHNMHTYLIHPLRILSPIFSRYAVR